MSNSDYKAAGARAGREDAKARVEKCAIRAWFGRMQALSNSPGGRHIFADAYEHSYDSNLR